MKPAITDGTCRLRCFSHCRQCQRDAAWRASVGAPDPCGDRRGPFGLGDAVEIVAKPIAKALGLPCLDKSGQLKPTSGCAKRKKFLNDLG